MDALIDSFSPPVVIRRLVGICYGFGNQILFLVTVWYLFWFLHDGAILSQSRPTVSSGWLLCDCGLALLFAFSHSVMLVPKTRRLLTRAIPAPFYDSTFCIVTCVSLLTLFFCWRQSATVIWEVGGRLESCIRIGFYVSWASMIYSLALTGLGYQNGWTTFYHWLRRSRAPRREFRPHGAYKLIRHPVYLSFLGLIWLTPRMTLDHAALTALWTVYIFYGSVLKDRRLESFLGDTYTDYERRVPGFPCMIAGPLGRRRTDRSEAKPRGSTAHRPTAISRTFP
jgi:protein-S-isoprenylcysteine O-methyltransferase Ste14